MWRIRVTSWWATTFLPLSCDLVQIDLESEHTILRRLDVRAAIVAGKEALPEDVRCKNALHYV